MSAAAPQMATAAGNAATSSLLEVEHLTMRFGGLVAIDDVAFVARQREITGIIGPNGAGKTTLFNCITGFYKPTVGRLTLFNDGRPAYLLEQMDGHVIGQKARVARTFQNIRLFAGMSVLENLMVAQHNKLMLASGYTVLGILGLPGYRKAEKAAKEKAVEWLERVRFDRLCRSFRRQFALWRTAAPRDRARHVHRSGSAVP